VLFEMLTGSPPFTGESDEQLATMILRRPAPIVSRRRKNAPVGLDLILIKALSKDPALRPASAEVFAQQLRELPEGRAAVLMRGKDALAARFLAAFTRMALAVLPAGRIPNGMARRLTRVALGGLESGGRAAHLLDAAVVNRRLRSHRRELASLERKRFKRLRDAECAESRASSEGVEAAQEAARLARELRLEAEVFERRIDEVARKASADEKRAAEAEEMARAAGG
jgi:hypothetical protein